MGQVWVYKPGHPLAGEDGMADMVRKEHLSQYDTGGRAFHIVPDIEPFTSPIDGKVVGGRRQKREHMRLHEVEEVGNEKPKPHKPAQLPPVAPDMAQIMREKGMRLA